MPVQTIEWIGKAPNARVRLIDQTELPAKEVYLERTGYRLLADDIRRLAVRGAPAIGVAGAFGVVLGMQPEAGLPPTEFRKRLLEVCAELAGTRPTAVNLFWAIERLKAVVERMPESVSSRQMLDGLEEEAVEICEEDCRLCRAIGEFGAELIGSGSRVLTHCNAGALATAGIGTALAAVYVAGEQGKKISVFVDETRPLFQGSRLTAWELTQAGIEATLICDNMAGSVMSRGLVDLVITGADRIAANGDVANKIGTYSVACLANRHGVPFYVAAPFSTFDLSISDGSKIPIEERNSREVTAPYGLEIAPEGIKVINPAFDVTPAELVSAIITDKGIIRPPYKKNIPEVLGAD